ncbi:MAG: O-methyltransferase [Anaerolineae bacterium]|nr:O-methyltransferase [Anaerolineae bacterium]
MTNNQAIADYVHDVFGAEDEALRLARDAPGHNGMPAISVRPEEGRVLQFLARAIGAQKIVEIGTLAGYSGIWLARALPDGEGKLYTIEADPKHAAVARESFARAGVSDRVEIREGEAAATLAALRAEGPFDFCFIDADKDRYPAYLDWALENLRPGGIVAAHNALRGGRIVAPENDTDHIVRRFNARMADDPRLVSILIPLGDGIVAGLVQG